MRFLVFQHIACEHPGIFRDFLAADGIPYDAVELDAGDKIPPLDRYDALWVMGGPMDVWEEDIHPWLAPEKAAIREAVWQRKMPYFGLCLGHQLLACSLDGAVGKMPKAEVGILDVALTEAGMGDPLMAGLSPLQQALQWHGAEVTKPPRDAVVLAASPLCEVQAMRVGANAYGLQYHVELTDHTVAEWGAVPAYAQALDAVMGPGSLPRLEQAAAARMPQFNAAAKRLYENFMQATLRGARAAQ